MTQCCGTPVPSIPERPFDIEQPAYVLVDGKWVDLAEVISRYTPGGGGAILQMRSESIHPDNITVLNTGSPKLLHAPSTVVPSSPESRLLVTATVVFNPSSVPTTDIRPYNTYIGARHETSSGVYDAADEWLFRAARAAHDTKTTSSTLTMDTFAFRRDFGVPERRADNGNWSIAAWGFNSSPNTISGAAGYLQWTFTEYLPGN